VGLYISGFESVGVWGQNYIHCQSVVYLPRIGLYWLSILLTSHWLIRGNPLQDMKWDVLIIVVSMLNKCWKESLHVPKMALLCYE
jgi:hypothetical protein